MLNRFTMRIIAFTFLLIFPFLVNSQDTLTILPKSVFYDIYEKPLNKPTPTGVIRLKNQLVAAKIPDSILTKSKYSFSLQVNCNALCDNYDRVGYVNLVLAPKNSTSYKYDSVTRIEIGRFITPFMYKDRDPKVVPYTFFNPALTYILKNKEYSSRYDFWIELGIEAVPYAAQKEVKGCDGRNDTYQGEVKMILVPMKKKESKSLNLIPISYQFMLNNYETGHTDTMGKTTKTFEYTLPCKVKKSYLFVISSNHGANEHGEEYVRRWHYMYVDNQMKMNYQPGGKSCEPYRKYNTQPNGIYENKPMSDSAWISWNNWCPGDAIPIRISHLGKQKSGKHTIRFTVPDAIFHQKQGCFPLSLYLLAK